MSLSRAFLLTHRLVKYRNDVRRLMGDGYITSVAPFRAVIRGLVSERKQTVSEVALSLADEMEEASADNSLVFAALVDELESGG